MPPEDLTIDDLAKRWGDKWYLAHHGTDGLWVATLKESSTVRVSAPTAMELDTALEKRMRIWKALGEGAR